MEKIQKFSKVVCGVILVALIAYPLIEALQWAFFAECRSHLVCFFLNPTHISLEGLPIHEPITINMKVYGYLASIVFQLLIRMPVRIRS
ncbi:MAG: hypothetical protein COV46_02425 [Deltaproteobacteria bacterium CG11_big_fil_rev_8_21_14_0_20_49_13]|nr:MAG: hypothetical protein COV46_02425 [Deltaproteobacteria bacterium CG11_big_fil_rev_8_21_14_0_20_49_13]